MSVRRQIVAITVCVIGIMPVLTTARGQEPIRLHPQNPHYFLWRGQPTVLITSAEHYGAVLNRAFNYTKYLDTLQANGFNLTRTFSGAYGEPVGAFNIANNTLAPAAGDLLCPWARSAVGGYANGGNKFDLTRWDETYFARLTDFVAQAGRRGIVVEFVLFCPFYKDTMWDLSPMNANNNINGIGSMARTDVYTLKDRELLGVQEAMVRRIVAALQDFDNVYFEICNEPYFGGVTLPWQRYIAEVIANAESRFEHRHLIAQNIANKSQVVENPSPHVSILNFHYAKPPEAVAQNYHWDRVIGDDETGFAGDDRVKPYRLEGWDFIVAGGAVYSNLDYSFAVGHEDGTAEIHAPGGGGPELWKQLRILKDFINEFDFVAMKPNDAVIPSACPEGTTARALVQLGKAYAIYVKGNHLRELAIDLPRGSYDAAWIDTKSGAVARAESFTHDGGNKTLAVPSYADDIALRIRGTGKQRRDLLLESDFEDTDMKGWKVAGNPTTLSREVARAGRQSVKASLDRYKDKISYRTEISGPHSDIGKEYWYGFSVFLPDDYVPDSIWEIVAQWHSIPDLDIGEKWRNPVLALLTTDGHWGLISHWDAKRNSFKSGKRQYDGTRRFDLGAYRRGVWTDWVIHVKWSYGADGLLQIWQDGQQVIDRTGPNAFNDEHGPFFKMGLYKGWHDPDKPGDAVSKRVLYVDEFRLGTAAAGYDNVAPGP